MKAALIFLTIATLNIKLVAGGDFSISSVQPPPQSMNFLPTLEILINFSDAIDLTSINDTSLQVWGRWSGAHTGTITPSNDTTSILFTTNREFFYGEWVTVSLSKGIKDRQGTPLPAGFAWNFWTRTLPGTMDLIRTQTINVRQQGEGPIQTYGAYAGDLDKDGWSDFVVPNEIPADIRVFMNDQQGGYNSFLVYSITGGSRPSTNEGLDFNLDGMMDFAVGNSANNKVTVFTGDGTGYFSSIQNYDADNGIRGLVVLHTDGDGLPDIVTANRDANNVSILMNNGDGTFSSPINFEGNGNGETAAATSDVNGDGIMDLFLGAIHSDEVILWLGDGNGGFTFSDKVTVGYGPWMISSGDVNNDGVPDVICANAFGSSFSVVFCDTFGNLSLPANYPVGEFPLSVDLGDVDGDLDLDIVTSNFTGANFTLYENDGTGVFVNRNDLPSNQAGSCAVFHDRDNDGDMDMTGIDELQDLLILFTNNPAANVNSFDNSPNDFNLFQNYPNPFNPSTAIQFSIPVEGFVFLNVFNALGEKVSTVVSENLNAGTYKYDWNAADLPSGIYFYNLTSDNFKQTKKLILMK